MSANKTLDQNFKLEESPDAPAGVVAKYLKLMENFESDRVEYIKKQNKIAWRVAGGAGVIATLAVGAVIAIAPLKTVEPYVIRVDNNTGYTDVVSPLSNGQETYEEKLNRFWLGEFVKYRESYYWNNVEENYTKVQLMSSPQVFSQYQTFIFSEASPVKVYGETKSIKVENNGTTFLSTPTGQVAQVRLTKTVIEKDGSKATGYPVTHWLATITYNYQKEIKTKKDEQVNPLRFNVLSYRVDAINN
ncbi:virB8 family protein [Vibrio vulnificus]